MKRNKKLSVKHLAFLLLMLCVSRLAIAQCTIPIDDSGLKKIACAGDQIDLSVVTPTGGTWSRYGSAIPTTFTQTYEGGATLKYTVSAGCSADITIAFYNQAKFDYIPSNNITASICNSANSIALTPSVPTNVTGVAYIDDVVATTLNPATLAAGPHEVKWVATSKGGCSVTSTKQFEIANPPAPTVKDQSVIQGTTGVTLVVIGETPSSTFQWWKKNGTAYDKVDAVDVSKPGIFDYQVAEKAGTCEGARSNMKLTVITNCATPAPSAPNVTVCDMDKAEVTATGDPNATFVWYTNELLSGTGLATATLKPTVAGDYYVIQQIGGGCQSPATKVTVSLTTKPLPPTVADVSACSNAPYKLSAVGTGIEWWKDQLMTGFSIAQGNDFVPSAPGTYYASQGIASCKSDAVAATLTITQAPKAQLKADNSMVCAGSKVTLTVDGTGSWFGTTPTTVSSTSYTYTSATSQTATFAYVSKLGTCTDTARLSVDFVSTTTPTLSASKNTACATELVSLQASPAGGTYSATNGGTVTNDEFSSATTGLSVVTYTVGAGTSCEAKATTSITVNASPTATIQTDKTSYCQGETISITTSNNGQLKTPAGAIDKGNGVYSYVANNAGDLDITYAATSGTCTNTAKKTVVVNAITYINFDQLSDLCAGDSATLFAMPAGGVFETNIGKIVADKFVSQTAGSVELNYIIGKGSACESKSTQTFEVFAKPVVTLVVDKPSTCIGDTVAITTSNNGQFVSTQTLTYAAAGKYKYKIADTKTEFVYSAISFDGCVDTARASVTAIGGGFASINFPLNATACIGSDVILSATPTGGEFTSTIGTISNNTFKSTVAAKGTITYTLGKGSACEAKLTKDIEVIAKPSITIITDKDTYCTGESMYITTTGIGALTLPIGAVDQGLGVYSYSSSTAASVVCQFDAIGSCPASVQKTVSVTAKPTITFQLPATACQGENISLSATPAGGVFEALGGTATGTNFVSSTPGTASISYIIGKGTACENKLTNQITIKTKAASKIATDKTDYCVGETIVITTPSGGSLSSPSGAIDAGSGIYNYKATASGLLNIEYEPALGACASTGKTTANVTENATISFTPPTSVCAGTVLPLSANPIGGIFETTGGVITGSKFKGDAVGDYTLSYVIGKGTACENKASAQISVLYTPSAPTITPSATMTIVKGTASASFTATNTSTETLNYSWKDNSGEIAQTAVLDVTTNTLEVGQYNYSVTASYQTCISQAATAKLTITDIALDYTDLKAMIQQVKDTLNIAEEGTAVGKYPVGSKAELSKALATADLALTSSVDQNAIYQATDILANALLMFSDSKIKLTVDYTALNAIIKKVNDSLTAPKGQYPAEAFTTLTTARDEAKKLLTSSDQAAITLAANTLSTALDAFAKSIILPVDRATLLAAIQKAIDSSKFAIEGTAVGQYPSGSLTSITDAIAVAQTTYNDPSANESGISSATATLNSALTTFLAQKNKYVVNKTDLELAIHVADSLALLYKDSLGVGDGQYSSSLFTKYINNLAAAKETLSNPLATQDEIMIAQLALESAWENFITQKTVVSRILLRAQLDDADALLVKARLLKGTSVGNYPAAAIETYETAIDVALGVYHKTAVTKEEILQAVSDLSLAMSNLQKSIITNVAVTKITVLFPTLTIIKGASIPINYTVLPTNASNKNVYFVVKNQEIVSVVDGELYGKEVGTTTIDIISIDGNIKASVTLVVSPSTGIEDQISESIRIFPSLTSGTVKVVSPTTGATISIISISGEVLRSIKQDGETTDIDLSMYPSASYKLIVESEGSIITQTTIIKY